MIVIMTGHAGAGKDTIADYLVSNYNFTKLSLATKLKEGVAHIFGWDYEMLLGSTPQSRLWREQPDQYWSSVCGRQITPRIALQQVGTECFRKVFGEDFWVGCLAKEIVQNKSNNYVISDARFMSEITYLKNLGGQVWEVQRSLPWYYTTIWAAKRDGTYDTDSEVLKIKEQVHSSELEWIYDNKPMHTIRNTNDFDTLYKSINELMKF